MTTGEGMDEEGDEDVERLERLTRVLGMSTSRRD